MRAAVADGVGEAARLDNPAACVLDGSGNMYVAERGGAANSCVIRKIALASRTVVTVAGSTCGYSDQAGTKAQFSSPQGIAFDPSGKLYVVDTLNHAIREVQLSNGAVSTLAGNGQAGAVDNTGTNARFSSPVAVYFDGAGSLYVADYNNHAIRRVSVNGGAVSTVVGTMGQAGVTNGTGTDARLHSPAALGFDGADKLYVSEDSNNDVRIVSLKDFSVTPHIGAPGSGGYIDATGSAALVYYPRGFAFDGHGSYYLADSGNNAIRKVDAAAGTVTTLAGLGAAFGSTDGPGPSATFNYPDSIVFDGTDTLYTADYTTSIIRSISLSKGTVTTLAGLAGNTGAVDGAPTAARFSSPSGLAVDGAGNLFVADRENHTIRKIVLASGTVSTFAGSAGNAGYREGSGTNALFSHPVTLAYAAGKLYVGELDNRTIRVVPLDGSSTSTLAGTPPANPPDNNLYDGIGTQGRFFTITGIAVKDGTVYVADTNRIRTIDIASGAVVTVTGGGGYSDGVGVYANFSFHPQPGGLAIDANGDLLVADYNNALIRRLSPKTHQSSIVAGIYGASGALLGPAPTSIATAPRAVVAIPGGIAFAAYYGIFTLR
jgi:sugar lactone lactonase YvrE